MQFFIPIKPISANHIWRTYRGRTVRSVAYNQFERDFILLSPRAVERCAGEVEVKLEFFLKDKRRRDLDNMIKPTIDCLTHLGCWNDDSQITRLDVRKSVQGEEGIRVTVTEA